MDITSQYHKNHLADAFLKHRYGIKPAVFPRVAVIDESNVVVEPVSNTQKGPIKYIDVEVLLGMVSERNGDRAQMRFRINRAGCQVAIVVNTAALGVCYMQGATFFMGGYMLATLASP